MQQISTRILPYLYGYGAPNTLASVFPVQIENANVDTFIL